MCVLAQAEDTGASNLAMHIFKTEVEAKLKPNVTVDEVLTDITVDGGPADLALDEELPELQIWRDVQHIKKNAKEHARGSPTDVKKYTAELVNVASPMFLCIPSRHICRPNLNFACQISWVVESAGRAFENGCVLSMTRLP